MPIDAAGAAVEAVDTAPHVTANSLWNFLLLLHCLLLFSDLDVLGRSGLVVFAHHRGDPMVPFDLLVDDSLLLPGELPWVWRLLLF